MRIVLASLLLCSFACGGTSRRVQAPGKLKVEDASLPYHIVQAKTGRELTHEEFYAELAGKKAVCVGESHDDVHHHWAQLTVVEQLAQPGHPFATGFEMFQRPFQGVLDDFVQGRIDEENMLLRSDWKRRWSYDWAFYAPTVRLTVKRGGQLLALNISSELKDKWKDGQGVKLSEAERAKIPELNLEDEQHRRWFRSLMESMAEGVEHGASTHADHAMSGEPKGTKKPAPAPALKGGESAASDDASSDDASSDDASSDDAASDGAASDGAASDGAPSEASGAEGDFIDKIYPVQVLWDETMADSAYRWLSGGQDRQMVILAGHGHCHDTAIVGRMKRRGLSEVVSVRPVVETGNGEVADLLSAPENDYLFVMDDLKSK